VGFASIRVSYRRGKAGVLVRNLRKGEFLEEKVLARLLVKMRFRSLIILGYCSCYTLIVLYRTLHSRFFFHQYYAIRSVKHKILYSLLLLLLSFSNQSLFQRVRSWTKFGFFLNVVFVLTYTCLLSFLGSFCATVFYLSYYRVNIIISILLLLTVFCSIDVSPFPSIVNPLT